MADVTIRLRDNGPLVVEGPVTVIDAEGNAFSIDPAKPAIALCRCGKTSRRPFCDGSHKECGFDAVDRVPTAE
jgi:CDGSH-type Zn-finger protein